MKNDPPRRGYSVAKGLMLVAEEVVEIRLLRRQVAFLSPGIVEAIAARCQPKELSSKALTERIELPLLCSDQERSVGMS